MVVKSPKNGELWQRRAQEWGEGVLNGYLVIFAINMLGVIFAKTQ